MSNGYVIKSYGIPISTITRDSVMQIKLTAGNFESFETKIEGNEISIDIRSGGIKKYATVRVPDGVMLTEVKFERTSDAIMITGPAKNNGGQVYVSNLNGGGANANFNNDQGFGQVNQPFQFQFPAPLIGFPYANVPQMWFF
jgi:hypothetical protein